MGLRVLVLSVIRSLHWVVQWLSLLSDRVYSGLYRLHDRGLSGQEG